MTGDGRLTAKDAYGKTGGGQSHRKAAFSENYFGKMVQHDRYKMVYHPGKTYGELYDLEEDPMPLPVRPDHQDMAPRQYELRHGGTTEQAVQPWYLRDLLPLYEGWEFAEDGKLR